MSEFRGGLRGHGGGLPLWPPPGDRERGRICVGTPPWPGRPEGREGGGRPLSPLSAPQTRGPGRAGDPSRVTGDVVALSVAVAFRGQEATLPAVTAPGRPCHTGRGHAGMRR